MRKLTNLLEHFSWLPSILTRLAVGAMFARGGWGKLHNLESVTEFFGTLGLPAFMAPVTGTIELVCGVMLIAGLFTRLASALLIGTMIGALVTAKAADIASAPLDLLGMEEFLLALVLTWLLFRGAECGSLDSLIRSKRGDQG